MGQTCGCTNGADVAQPDTLRNSRDRDEFCRLDLSETKMDDRKAGSVVDTVRRNDSLRVLNLAWCEASFQAAKLFCDTVSHHASLTSLILTGNSISDVGPIAQLLSRDPPLTYLNLSCNQINRNGFVLILNSLERNTNLKMLSLGGNKVDGISLEERGFIAGELKGNRTLRMVDLRGNPLSEEVLQGLMDDFSEGLRLRLNNTALQMQRAVEEDAQSPSAPSVSTQPSQSSNSSLGPTTLPPNPPGPPPRIKTKPPLLTAESNSLTSYSSSARSGEQSPSQSEAYCGGKRPPSILLT